MMTEKINKAKVLIAQGQSELLRIKEPLASKFHGKVRTICRRAAGFYISAYLELYPKAKYGSSFINQLRSVADDNDIPNNIRNCAKILIVSSAKKEITGEEARVCCNNLINYFNILIQKAFS